MLLYSYRFFMLVAERCGNTFSAMVFQLLPCKTTAAASRSSSFATHSLWSIFGSKKCRHRLAHSKHFVNYRCTMVVAGRKRLTISIPCAHGFCNVCPAIGMKSIIFHHFARRLLGAKGRQAWLYVPEAV